MSISLRNDPDLGSVSSEKSGRKVAVGRVSTPHGARGELSVVPLTDFPERFLSMKTLDLYRDDRLVRSLPVNGVRANESKGTLILDCGLNDRDEAQELAGTFVMVDPEDRVPLPEGHFWIDDLIGLKVEKTDGTFLGTVENLLSAGGNEVYEIRDPEGALHYVPAVAEFVRELDVKTRKMTIALIEGLWD